MYYPCSENKGADQLRGYREADLRLCFRLGKNLVFSRCGSYKPMPYKPLHEKNNNLGFRPGPTQNGLYSHRRWLEAVNFGFRKPKKLYYPCSANKGADQLHSYCEADLRLYFHQCRFFFFARQFQQVPTINVLKKKYEEK